MTNARHDIKYWLAIIIPVISILATAMRLENRMTRMEASIERLAQVSEIKQEQMEKRIIELEHRLAQKTWSQLNH